MHSRNPQSLLNKKLESLENRLDKIKKDLSKSHSQDFAEQASERENDEVLEEIARETAETIHQLKAALKRIELGTYGLCDGCGQAISDERLLAMPEATHCKYCAE